QISGEGHNVSGSYGYYNGEHAFAIGLSGTNSTSNLVYRASGSLNTRGNVALGAGLGYQFDNIVTRSKEMLKLQRNGNINLLDEKVYELELQFNEMKKELEELRMVVEKFMKK
ncbi:YadA-like family protein, partial [Streptobacillus ratti]